MKHTCFFVHATLVCIFINLASSQNVFNTTPSPLRTNFSCLGRKTGFYADTESNCRVYHTCDENGNKFTYHCPIETAFRQDALICDHAHLVKCNNGNNPHGNQQTGSQELEEPQSFALNHDSNRFNDPIDQSSFTRSFSIFPQQGTMKPSFALNSSVFLRQKETEGFQKPENSNPGAAKIGSSEGSNFGKANARSHSFGIFKTESDNFGAAAKLENSNFGTNRPFGAGPIAIAKVETGNFGTGARSDFGGGTKSQRTNFGNPELRNDSPGNAKSQGSHFGTNGFPLPAGESGRSGGRKVETGSFPAPKSIFPVSNLNYDSNFGKNNYTNGKSETSDNFASFYFGKFQNGNLHSGQNLNRTKNLQNNSFALTSTIYRNEKEEEEDKDEGRFETSTISQLLLPPFSGKSGFLGKTNFERAVERNTKRPYRPLILHTQTTASHNLGPNNYPYMETLRSFQSLKENGKNPAIKDTLVAGTTTTANPFKDFVTLPLKPYSLEDNPYYPLNPTTEVYYTANVENEVGIRLFHSTTPKSVSSTKEFIFPEVLPNLNSVEDLVDRRRHFYIPKRNNQTG